MATGSAEARSPISPTISPAGPWPMAVAVLGDLEKDIEKPDLPRKRFPTGEGVFGHLSWSRAKSSPAHLDRSDLTDDQTFPAADALIGPG